MERLDKSTKTMLKAFTSNKGLKLLSILLAIVCWYGIQGITGSDSTSYDTTQPEMGGQGQAYERTVSLPVKVMLPATTGGLEVQVDPPKVEVELEIGKPVRPPSNKIMAFVDCSGISEAGNYRLPVHCIYASDSSTIDISPRDVTVYIEFFEPEDIKKESDSNRGK